MGFLNASCEQMLRVWRAAHNHQCGDQVLPGQIKSFSQVIKANYQAGEPNQCMKRYQAPPPKSPPLVTLLGSTFLSTVTAKNPVSISSHVMLP